MLISNQTRRLLILCDQSSSGKIVPLFHKDVDLKSKNKKGYNFRGTKELANRCFPDLSVLHFIFLW